MASFVMVDALLPFCACVSCGDTNSPQRFLACSHSTCEKCLASSSADNIQIVCKVCGFSCALPPSGISGLPQNELTRALQASCPSASASSRSECISSSSSQPLCDLCEDPNAGIVKCEQCQHYLCQVHKDAHSLTKTTRTHVLMGITEGKRTGATMRKYFCKKHPVEELKLYCESCQQPFCRDCTIDEHKDHNYVYLEKVADSSRSELQTNLEKLAARKHELHEATNLVGKEIANVKIQVDNLRGRVNEYYNSLLAAIEVKRREALTAVDMHAELLSSALADQRRNLQLALSNMNASQVTADRIVGDAAQLELIALKPVWTASLRELLEIKLSLLPLEKAEHLTIADGSKDMQAFTMVVKSPSIVPTTTSSVDAEPAAGVIMGEAVWTLSLLDPANKAVTLGNSNRSASVVGPGLMHRLIKPMVLNIGKHEWEIRVDSLPSPEALGLGVDNPALTIKNPAFMYGWLGNGKRRQGVHIQNQGLSWGAGDVLRVILDTSQGTQGTLTLINKRTSQTDSILLTQLTFVQLRPCFVLTGAGTSFTLLSAK